MFRSFYAFPLVCLLLLVAPLAASADYPQVVDGLNREHCTAPAHHEVIELLARNVAYNVDSEEEIARLELEKQALEEMLRSAPLMMGQRLGLAIRLAIVNKRLEQQADVREQLSQGIVKVDDDGETLRQLDSPVEVVDAIYDRNTSFQMVLVKDKHQNFTLLFRGTEPKRLGDIRDDLGGVLGGLEQRLGGIGARQYQENREEINAVIDKLQAKYPGQKVTVSGHSLGAALAQRFAIENPDIVKELVLFNAPALEQNLFDQLEAIEGGPERLTQLESKTTHHFGYKDPVSDLGGDRHLPGKVVIHYGESLSGLSSHTGEMMQNQNGEEPSCVTVPFEDYQRDRPGTGRFDEDAGAWEQIKAVYKAWKQDDIPPGVAQAEPPVDFEYKPVPIPRPTPTPRPSTGSLPKPVPAPAPTKGGGNSGSIPRPAGWLEFLRKKK